MNNRDFETQVEQQSTQKLAWKTYMLADAITTTFSVGWKN